ncbi:MAG: SDR family NAD(P)-dependent oxidoreductase [Thermogutta sp.]|nr:SDR family NAD(P)-dependent oxidoreductase [Thermogutta terrifontis]
MKDTIFSLAGRTALITGASRGIGRAIAQVFAQAGADLFICSRTEEAIRKTAEELSQSTGQRVEWLAADVARREDTDRLAAEALARMGHIDILINNAGWNIPQAIDEIQDKDWDYLVELNLTNAMRLTRALVPKMKERRWGRIIHMSSMMALASTAKRNAYSATKAALVGMAKASALDLGPFNITVNCIAPGPIATEMPMTLLSKEQQEQIVSRTALGRWGQPEEVAWPTLLLASEAGRYITGQVIVVDGGCLARIF